jgi:23S rRNA A2030 N6-methylase RlmJ
VAGLNGVGVFMVNPPIFHAQAVQQLITALLLGDSLLCRAADV